MTDDQLYTKLDSLYQTIVSYNNDQIGEVIDSFNSGYLRTPLSTRQELSQSAYALRDQIKRRKTSSTTLSTRTIRSMWTISPILSSLPSGCTSVST